MYPQSSIAYEPLPYSDFSCQSAGKSALPSPCLLLGLLAVVFVLMQRSSSSRQYYGPQSMYTPHGLASMLSSAVSARLSANNNNESSPEYLAKDGDKQYTEEEKAQHDKALRRYIQRHDKAIVVVFAYWCPHCHSLIESLPQHDLQGRKVLLVNGDACAAQTFSGDKAVCQLKYYPSVFVVDKGTLVAKGSVQEAIGETTEEETASLPEPAEGGVDADEGEQEEGAVEPFAALF